MKKLNNKWYIPVIIILLILCLVLLFVKCEHNKNEQSLPRDDSASDWSGEQNLSKPTVDNKPAIAIPCFPDLIFESGTVKQNVNFYNPEINDCYFQMNLFIGYDLIWKSGNVAPGKGFYEIELSKPLHQGEYNGDMLIKCYKQNGTELNSARVKFKITVE